MVFCSLLRSPAVFCGFQTYRETGPLLLTGVTCCYISKPVDYNFSKNNVMPTSWLTDTIIVTNQPLIACKGISPRHLFFSVAAECIQSVILRDFQYNHSLHLSVNELIMLTSLYKNFYFFNNCLSGRVLHGSLLYSVFGRQLQETVFPMLSCLFVCH